MYNHKMVGIILALLCALFIALSQIQLRKSFKDFKPSVAFFFDAIFGFLLWIPLALLMGVNLGNNLQEALMFALISAILSEAIVFFALSHGEIAITATIIATYPVYTVILSWLINHERISPGLLAFIAMAIIGSIWATLPNENNLKIKKLSKVIVWPFIAAFCIGLSDTISKGFIDRSNDFSFLFMLGFIQIPVALIYLRIEKQNITNTVIKTINNLSMYKHALLGGLLNIIGTGFLWLSFSYSLASIASPITGISGALTVYFSHIVFKEKLRKSKYFAIFITFIGVLGILIIRSR